MMTYNASNVKDKAEVGQSILSSMNPANFDDPSVYLDVFCTFSEDLPKGNLSELKKLENQFRGAYNSVRNVAMDTDDIDNKYYSTYMNIVDLRQAADTPINRALEELEKIRNNLDLGNYEHSSILELAEVKKKARDAYFTIPVESCERRNYQELAFDITGLQLKINKRVEKETKEELAKHAGLNGLIVEAEKEKALETRKSNSTYQNTRTKGDIFANVPLFDSSGNTYEKVELSVDFLARAEYSPEVLKAAQKRLRLLRAIGLDRTQDEKLQNLYQKFENTTKELADFDQAMINLNDLLATSKSSTQEIKTTTPYTNVNDDIVELSSEDFEIINDTPEIEISEVDVDLSELEETAVDVTPVSVSYLPKNLETVVTQLPKPRKTMPALSKAALVAAAFAGFGAVIAGIGYSYFNSSVKHVNALEESASLSMSVDTPQIKETKPYAKASSQEAPLQREAYKLPVNEPIEVTARPSLMVKPIPKIDPSKTVYSIQKGDTFVKLHQKHAGKIPFEDWLKDVRSANPQIEDLDWIAPEQPVQLPQ